VIDTLAPETTRTVALLAAGALSLVLAVGIYYGVERPASARLRRAVRAGLLRGGETVRSYVSKPADTPAVRTP
jgi:peptidoglycan/LPS O-acetylase OafA/YrhL